MLGLSQLHVMWTTNGGWYDNAVPEQYKNLEAFEVTGFLQFRAGVDYKNQTAGQGDPDFSVVLEDGNEFTSRVLVSDYSAALRYPPGALGVVPKAVLSTVRIPLSAFESVDLSDVRHVRFEFDQNPHGAILVADLAFSDAYSNPGVDDDGDGVPNLGDNCIVVANADQRDTNLDGYGNLCDPDLNNSCVVNFVDVAIMRSVFFTNTPDADLNGDGVVNFGDLGILSAFAFLPPGPSGITQLCD